MFLLGAGASMDAGMPSVEELTVELQRRLPDLRDINAAKRSEFCELFCQISKWDPEAAKNYERFFGWLSLLYRAEMNPFRHGLRTLLPNGLAGVAGELAFVIKRPILDTLRDRHHRPQYDPSYLAKLADFIPNRGRLDVFTLNFDLCVEDAFKAHDTDVATGFRCTDGKWSPRLFHSGTGINLYKLHGSLNWCLGPLQHDGYRPLTEVWPPDWSREGEFLLGPGPKLQHDDPFVTLYSELHKALRRAKACVVIGYSFRDEHIKGPLHEASRRGMTVIDVKPAGVVASFKHSRNVSLGGKQAFESSAIRDAVKSVTQ